MKNVVPLSIFIICVHFMVSILAIPVQKGYNSEQFKSCARSILLEQLNNFKSTIHVYETMESNVDVLWHSNCCMALLSIKRISLFKYMMNLCTATIEVNSAQAYSTS